MSAGRAIGSVWRALCSSPRVAVIVEPGPPFLAASRTWAVRLRVSKLVFVDTLGAVIGADGSRVSFVHLDELMGLLSAPAPDSGKRTPLLREVEAALRGGVPAVNVCTADALGEELFSYAGSGTLFTLGRYVEVRRLGIDDFDAANDLVARGVAEGYLAPRSEEELDLVFANGFGAFVESSHLAGIGALIPHPESRTSEVASLYALTRFLGEGIGGQLLDAFFRTSAERGDAFLFACTTTERVAGLFERFGFCRVGPEDLPDEKWRGYDRKRRARLICLRRDAAV
jgi:N-acetylglutamate synthase-like GNAT family acetyltransferase